MTEASPDTNADTDPRPHPRATWYVPAGGTFEPWAPVLRRAAEQDVVLLGESHDVAEIHRWQLHAVAALHVLRPNLAVGFEMFPRDVQPVLDRWVAGLYDTDGFLAAVDWPAIWGFDPALYLPLFEFCRQQMVPMIALNCRRGLVSAVGCDGWEAVPDAAREGITPPAPASPAYRRYLFAATGGGAMGGRTAAAGADDPAFARIVRAQQCWDRAFACAIADHRARLDPPPLVAGIIGRGHLEHGFGVPAQLHDLGIGRTCVLLPAIAETIDPAAAAGLADAVFRLDAPDRPTS
ncbi:ChaN family lipoprotein [Blastochloris tepida]|nr:ChaN family lipoprotein [Blastochloris tepida]